MEKRDGQITPICARSPSLHFSAGIEEFKFPSLPDRIDRQRDRQTHQPIFWSFHDPMRLHWPGESRFQRTPYILGNYRQRRHERTLMIYSSSRLLLVFLTFSQRTIDRLRQRLAFVCVCLFETPIWINQQNTYYYYVRTLRRYSRSNALAFNNRSDRWTDRREVDLLRLPSSLCAISKERNKKRNEWIYFLHSSLKSLPSFYTRYAHATFEAEDQVALAS